MAEEIAKGVQSVEGVSLKLKRISETLHKDLLEADAIIVGSRLWVHYGMHWCTRPAMVSESCFVSVTCLFCRFFVLVL